MKFFSTVVEFLTVSGKVLKDDFVQTLTINRKILKSIFRVLDFHDFFVKYKKTYFSQILQLSFRQFGQVISSE